MTIDKIRILDYKPMKPRGLFLRGVQLSITNILGGDWLALLHWCICYLLIFFCLIFRRISFPPFPFVFSLFSVDKMNVLFRKKMFLGSTGQCLFSWKIPYRVEVYMNIISIVVFIYITFYICKKASGFYVRFFSFFTISVLSI